MLRRILLALGAVTTLLLVATASAQPLLRKVAARTRSC